MMPLPVPAHSGFLGGVLLILWPMATVRKEPAAAAVELVAQRFVAAEVALLAGSVMRGEDTETSDLDVVVVYARLDHAHRESFMHAGWPVEAFVHDPETLEFFYERDRASGVPVLLDMVVTGVPLPRATSFARRVQARAESVLRLGPSPWGAADIERSRYTITALCEDLRGARSQDERVAIATALYPAAADHFFRARNRWSARGKNLLGLWQREA